MKNMAVIRIKDLSLRTFIGFKPHERKYKQDVVVNVDVEIDTETVESSDDIETEGFFDYRDMSKSITGLIEESRYDLLEALVRRVLDEVMSNTLVRRARVEIEKPNALRYSSAVSVELFAEREIEQ